jgi:hypothetical protein
LDLLLQQCHGQVFKKLARSIDVDTNTMGLWFKRLLELLEGYGAWDMYNAAEKGVFFNCLPDRMLALKGETVLEEKVQRSNL